MNKFLKSVFLILIILFVGFSSDFLKREINVYINDISSDKVNVIEKFYFNENISYNHKKNYLNTSYLLRHINLSMKPIGNVKTNLVGDNLNILEVKYSTKPFKLLQKTGRFIKKVINSSSFNGLKKINNSLVLDNKTILKFYILKEINNNFIIPENIKDLANVYLSEDRSYLVYEFDGPKILKNFKIIKEYKEPILYFNPNDIWNPFYVLTVLIIFGLCIIYLKDIIIFIKKVFK